MLYEIDDAENNIQKVIKSMEQKGDKTIRNE